MSHDLRRLWSQLLPHHESLGAELLTRWSEPHRTYHGQDHLRYALAALASLGDESPAERLAIWFHDAVHTGSPGADEHRSAEFATERLTGVGLSPVVVGEVARLVLVTIDHSPAPGDLAGARVSDADLAILGAGASAYARSVDALRAESELPEADWRAVRTTQLSRLLASERLFHTAAGWSRWERAARRNLGAELARLERRMGNSATR